MPDWSRQACGRGGSGALSGGPPGVNLGLPLETEALRWFRRPSFPPGCFTGVETHGAAGVGAATHH